MRLVALAPRGLWGNVVLSVLPVKPGHRERPGTPVRPVPRENQANRENKDRPGHRGSGFTCPKGFEPGTFTLNAPGGQVTLYVCMSPVVG